MIGVERVDYVRVPVADIDVANRFYCELLASNETRTRPPTTGASTRPATSPSPS